MRVRPRSILHVSMSRRPSKQSRVPSRTELPPRFSGVEAAVRHGPFLACLACGLPLLLWHSVFGKLWYFGDEWVELSEIPRFGLMHWLVYPFAENFVPLFKLLWAAAIYVFHGQYFALIALDWSIHILNLLLLAELLKRWGMRPAAIVFAVLMLGMPWSNIESLGWALQVHGLLSSTTYLLAWFCLLQLETGTERTRRWPLILYFLCIIAAPLFHSRGILNGIALGAPLLIYGLSGTAESRRRWIWLGILSIAATFLLAGSVSYLAPAPNLKLMHGPNLLPMALHALYYLALNPLFDIALLGWQQFGVLSVLAFGALKALILVRGFLRSPRKLHPFLISIVVMDLGYSAILGMGRYHAGLGNTISSRYQYMSLFCFAPFLAVVVDDIVRQIGRIRLRRTIYTAALLAWALFLLLPWRQRVGQWSDWRGSQVRQAMISDLPQKTMPFSLITVREARELAVRFHLN